jgi:hypothetical protein
MNRRLDEWIDDPDEIVQLAQKRAYQFEPTVVMVKTNRPSHSLPHVESELNRGGTKFLERLAKEIDGGMCQVEFFGMQTEPLAPPDFESDPAHNALPVKVTYSISIVRNSSTNTTEQA